MSRVLSPTVSSPADVDLAHAAAQAVVESHRRLAAWMKVGMTLGQIDQFIAATLDDLGCKSCFYRYKQGGRRGPEFPSQACLSLNDCVVHGTAGSWAEPMKPGDVLKVDIGVTRRGWIGDAGWTYTFREFPPGIAKLVEVGKESLRRGVATMQPGAMLITWAQEVQEFVEHRHGFHLIRGLGGHGYGRKLHAPPFVSNVVPMGMNDWTEAFSKWTPGMLVAVEPMIAVGTGEVRQNPREWPVYTADGSLSVHYEHDVLITDRGPRVLTEGMEELPDLVG